jgi:hypothetical protein
MNNLKARNRALFWILMGLAIALYITGFIKTGGRPF